MWCFANNVDIGKRRGNGERGIGCNKIAHVNEKYAFFKLNRILSATLFMIVSVIELCLSSTCPTHSLSSPSNGCRPSPIPPFLPGYCSFRYWERQDANQWLFREVATYIGIYLVYICDQIMHLANPKFRFMYWPLFVHTHEKWNVCVWFFFCKSYSRKVKSFM